MLRLLYIATFIFTFVIKGYGQEVVFDNEGNKIFLTPDHTWHYLERDNNTDECKKMVEEEYSSHAGSTIWSTSQVFIPIGGNAKKGFVPIIRREKNGSEVFVMNIRLTGIKTHICMDRNDSVTLFMSNGIQLTRLNETPPNCIGDVNVIFDALVEKEEIEALLGYRIEKVQIQSSKKSKSSEILLSKDQSITLNNTINCIYNY